jgi:hypothetical protein
VAPQIDKATGNPIVELTASSIDGEIRTTTVRIDKPLNAAAAPATLIDLATRAPVLELHRIAHEGNEEVAFETYGTTADAPTGPYVLQPWWAPYALALVLDRSRTWTLAEYPSGAAGDLPDLGHDFCPLTYASCEPGTDAYTDTKGAWISVEAYESFIAGDLLRLGVAKGDVVWAVSSERRNIHDEQSWGVDRPPGSSALVCRHVVLVLGP